MSYQEQEGDLIKLAQEGSFDGIAHGCNCFCRMKKGIAPQIAKAFGADNPKIFQYESNHYYGDINKLGLIEYHTAMPSVKSPNGYLKVINCYTQHKIKAEDLREHDYATDENPFDYLAFTLCMQKINYIFKNKYIGLPQIGSHLAGGEWGLIKPIIQKKLKDCFITVVIYKP